MSSQPSEARPPVSSISIDDIRKLPDPSGTRFFMSKGCWKEGSPPTPEQVSHAIGETLERNKKLLAEGKPMIFITCPPFAVPFSGFRIAWEDDGEYLTRLGEGTLNSWSDPEIPRRVNEQQEHTTIWESEYATISRYLAMGRKLRPVV